MGQRKFRSEIKKTAIREFVLKENRGKTSKQVFAKTNLL